MSNCCVAFAHTQALREKEKGDWKKLTIDEKKILYRASFRQTFSEMDAPTGEWKGIIGMSMLAITSGIWLYLYFKTFGTFLTDDKHRRYHIRVLYLPLGRVVNRAVFISLCSLSRVAGDTHRSRAPIGTVRPYEETRYESDRRPLCPKVNLISFYSNN